MKRKARMRRREQAYRDALREAEIEVAAVYILVYRARGALGYLPPVDWDTMPVLTS